MSQQGLLRDVTNELDTNYVEEWADRLGVKTLFMKLQNDAEVI